MSYLSPEFALAFTAFLLLYWGLQRWVQPQKWLLLAASYLFYGLLDWRFALILFLYSGVVMLCVQGMARSQTYRRHWTAGGIAASVVNLAVFKYYDFFRDQMQTLMDGLHLGWVLPPLDILMPVGISFYTFQAIAYLVSVAKGKYVPAKPLDTLLYLSFFPSLLAGPICRPEGLLKQLQSTETRHVREADLALVLLISALTKKIWLASWLADAWVTPLFANPDAYHGLELLLGMYAYALQIYFDFSGYTELVIALALLLGYQLPQNFNQPYLATSLRDFWRRWHITLSSWIRDFVYIPLGGSRAGWGRTQLNLFSAMVISGLWHGASIKYLFWGALHGGGMVVQNAWDELQRRRATPWHMPEWLAMVITFHFVCIAWVYFRADSAWDATHYLASLGHFSPRLQLNVLGGFAFVAACFVFWRYSSRLRDRLLAGLRRLPWYIKPLPLAGLVQGIIMLAPSGVPAFIYYQY
ncbi:MBOAT family O-acyltransferase [Chitinilyticum piscinae]|uniref:Probable alginate O-acetylase AlgI n=1 Tax=Chitinilyticum piscinae TaxID=2866724 RepID=A0A8J7FL88_9NEIS|nr:MBOAT family protein [Chitinilyticum piscinae]MBE9608444.1 MBOAT family protein [Chitinilyticum piscinae]